VQRGNNCENAEHRFGQNERSTLTNTLALNSGTAAFIDPVSGRVPSVLSSLYWRMLEGPEVLVWQLAICQLPRVEDRALAVMRLLPAAWRRVTPAQTPALASDERLGGLVGARRPTVNLAGGNLAERGASSQATSPPWSTAATGSKNSRAAASSLSLRTPARSGSTSSRDTDDNRLVIPPPRPICHSVPRLRRAPYSATPRSLFTSQESLSCESRRRRDSHSPVASGAGTPRCRTQGGAEQVGRRCGRVHLVTNAERVDGVIAQLLSSGSLGETVGAHGSRS